MPARVVVIGDALIDELVDDEGTAHHVGGSALNVAVGLSILGVPASLVAMIGDDVDGALIRGHLADFGVELLPTITPHGTGIARSERVDGEPRYGFSESMAGRAIAFDDAQRTRIADAEIVAISGFPFDAPGQFELLADAVAGRPHVAVDPNPRLGLLHDGEAFRRALEGFGGTAQLIKLGDDDARLLWNEPVAELAPRLLARYPYVLTTEGGAGASIRIGDARWRHPSLVTPETHVDTMGAGDAVFASVLAEIATLGIRDIDWFDALERAMRIAAATVAQPGAQLRLPA
jgi:fructokinase